MKLILATGNENKVIELRKLLANTSLTIETLADYPEIGEIVEDGKTFAENAEIKARAVHKVTGNWVLADDSGLVVKALGGAPGIYSSRYAGRAKDYAGNNEKLLRELKDVPRQKRQAEFICAMVLLGPDEGERYLVEGRLAGVIGESLQGKKGFGYDPLFYLPERGKTLAELEMAEKNKISHRGRALARLRNVLLDILARES